MTEERLEPMDADLDDLLRAERLAQPPAAALDRVRTRVVSGGGGGSDAGSEGGPTNGASARASSSGWLASHASSIAIAAFVLGGAAGATLLATLRKPPSDRVVYVYAPAPPAASSEAQPSAEPAPMMSAARVVAPSPPTVSAAPASSSSLAVERALLDETRVALTTGDPARALSLTSEHAHRFPRAQLVEEREALAVQSLVSLGRYAEARARAARLRAMAPNSLFLSAVDESLASIP